MNSKKIKVVRTVRPGLPGTHKYVRRYGDLLVAVRYRYDSARSLRFTTVEVVVDERPWRRGYNMNIALDGLDPPESVLVRVSFHETQLRARVRGAGGRWDARWKAWELPLETVKRMGLEGRIVFKAEQRNLSR